MIRVYIANAKVEESSAIRLMLQDLKMEVVGEASDWQTTLAKAPKTRLNTLLIDWNLLPQNSIASMAELREACTNEIVVVLTSYLDARQQVALATGADTFISKGETPNRLADQLRAVAKTFNIHETSYQPLNK
jgi:DNA-binding NarL/FixJ family response regulator